MAPYKSDDSGKPETDYETLRRPGLFFLKQNSWYGFEQTE